MEATNVQKLAEMGLTVVKVTSFDMELSGDINGYKSDTNAGIILVPTNTVINKTIIRVEYNEECKSINMYFSDGVIVSRRLVNIYESVQDAIDYVDYDLKSQGFIYELQEEYSFV
jgi:hypothetical protein